MNDGGAKPDDKNTPDGDNVELEVSDKDLELVSADVESPGDEGTELPTDDNVVEGDLPAPDEDPEPTASEEDKLDEELEALEAEEEAEEAAVKEKVAEEEMVEDASEEATVASEDKPEEKPEEKSTEEDKPVEEKPAGEETAKEETGEEEKPTEEEKKDEEPVAEPVMEAEPAKEEAPAKEEVAAAAVAANVPVDNSQASDTFPIKPAEETKKNNKTGLFVMIAIIILLLISFGIFFALGGSKTGGNNGGNNAGNGGDEVTPSKVDGLTEFDVKLLKDFEDKKNIVYSPMSIKYAMSMLIDGTDGNTKQELVDVIGDYKPTNYTMSEHLSIANAIFVRDSFKDFVKTSYTDAIKQKYGANTIYDPFNNAATINDWVYKNTFSMIPEILKDDELKRAVFIIGNTVAIDMDWENMIQCYAEELENCLNQKSYGVSYKHENYWDTVKSYLDDSRSTVKLNSKDALALDIAASINNYDIVSELGEDTIRNTVKAAYEDCKKKQQYDYECRLEPGQTIDEYIDKYIEEIDQNYGQSSSSTDFLFYVDENVKMFAKDLKVYDGTQLQYVGIMPMGVSLSDYIKTTSADSINTLIGGLKEVKNENFADGKVTKITGLIPEFDFSDDRDLVKEFMELGVNEVFTKDANLSVMLVDDDKTKEVTITDIKHAAKIEFSNFGIRAAGATILVGRGGAGEAEFDYLFDVPVVEIDMTFDQPFMYLIRDKATGEVWFMGTVYEGKAPN